MRNIGGAFRVAVLSVGVLAGCRGEVPSGPAPAEPQVVRAALNASPKTSDFIFEAQNSIVLHSSPLTVNGGDIGARGTGTVGPFLSGGVAIDISSGAKVQTTHNVIADSIRLNSSIVVGDLQTNRLVNPSSGTHGKVTALVPLPALPTAAAVAPGTQNLNVTGTTTSSPGKFLTVTLGSNAVWRLAAGTYEMKDLTVGTNGHIEATGAVQLRIANRLNAGSGFCIGAKSGVNLTAKDIRIEVSGLNGTDGALASTPKAAVLSSNGNVRALILVPNGTLSFASSITAKGAFLARDIDAGSATCAYTFEDGFANTATCTAQSCNDNNACTNDVCGTNGVCTHTNVSVGTACSDGNPCNGAETCNASGVCQAGTPVTCTASDQCHTAGTCNSATGVCSNPAKADGTTCNDGDACTTTETCHAGACNGGTAKTCTASDQCHTAGTCDPVSGACSNPAKANGTACNDGNACTLVDSCQAGACSGASPITCVASDQCHVAGVCDPTSGACTSPAKPDGTACSDGDACTTAEACHAGACNGGTPKTCVATDQCHVAGMCNSATGVCSNPAKADGTTCSDGDACTTAEACHAGACNGGTPKTCTALDQCHTAGTCDPTSGVCSNPTKPEGTGCNDDDLCTIGDRCQIGICKPTSIVTCSTPDQCHGPGTCDRASGVCSNPTKPDGTTCSDGDACTTAEACHAGTCSGGTPKTCTASDQCHTAGTCDPTSGACSNPAKTDGVTCDDGDACTTAEACHAGACNGGTSKTCTASDQCHTAGTCDPTSGACSNPAKTDGVTCDDGDACTTAEACHAGACKGGTSKTCTASDQCHTAGTCDPTSGACSNPAKTDGVTCDDGDACTTAEACLAGACSGGTAKTCAASDQCHAAGTCDRTTGVCTNPAKPDGTTCSDGNPATSGDTCTAGACTGTTGTNPCAAPVGQCLLAGTRDPATGVCSYGFQVNGTTCDDGNSNTYSDRCQSGKCLGTPIQPCYDYEDCDDGNPCTQGDSCYNGNCHGQLITCSAGTSECGSYCDPTTGACTTGPSPNGTSCDDGSSCTSGDVCSAGVCGGVGLCEGQVEVSEPEDVTVVIGASVPLVIAADRAFVRPNEDVTLTAKLTFEGVSYETYGRLEITNKSPSEYVIPGYSVTVEYQSAVSHEWVALARLATDATGQVLPQTTPYSPPTFTYDHPQDSPTVTYGLSGISGTRIGSGGTADFQFHGTVVLPQEALNILADPAQSLGIRQAVRVDAGGGLPDGGEAITPFAAPAGSDFTISDLTPVIRFGGNSIAFSPSSIPTMSPGMTVTLTGVASKPLTLPPPGSYGYVQSLTYAATNTFYAYGYAYTGTTSFGGFVYTSSNSLQLPSRLPVVSTTIVSGPSTTPAGFPLTYNLTLTNPGNEAATEIVVQDTVSIYPAPYSVVNADITAPTTLAPQETQAATVVWQSPSAQEDNVDAIVQVSWKDGVGNIYGPVNMPWYNHLSPPLPLGTIALAGQATAPMPVGGTQTLTATALDPYGKPAPGVTVQLTVTGADAQVLSAPTNAAGVATFAYNGRLPGADTLVASATITTAPTQSNQVAVFWSAPYGTCTSPDGPLDVVIVIDTSSSMEGPNLEAAKAAAHSFLDTMDLSRDQLGVVSFGAFAGLNLPLTSDFGQAFAGIDSVFPGGGWINPTSIGAGVDGALDELASTRHRATSTPIIVFVSDGGNSWGDPEPALARLAASGIRTFAFALGSDADFVTLQRIASSKNELFYVPTGDELVWLYGNLRHDLCRNQLPLVHAGGNQGAYSVRLPHELTLHGEVHDDGPVELLASEWSVVSGPAPVTFLDASAPNTIALFAEPGTYVLRLTASDGEFTGTDDATVTVDPEPSLVGASLVTTFGTPGPLTVGTPETVLATLTDAGGHSIGDYAVQVTVAGPNATTATVLTDATGVASFSYTGTVVGTDVLTATALAATPLSSAPVSLAWAGVETATVATQGWIGSPLSGAHVTDGTPITLAAGVTLTSGTLTYWPASAPDRVRTLATGVTGGPGATLATLDTTTLANGSYVLKLDATNDAHQSQISLVGLTVGGEYKPGRVVVEVTDFTMPVAGMPITLGRRYDSLEKDNVGEFGNGWSLTVGHPRLEVDAFHNVTMTMLDGRRQTFYFAPTFPSVGPVVLGFFLLPKYTAEAGAYGSLTSDGCQVLAFNPYADVPNPTCFGAFDPSELAYAPTTYQYTDPFGTVYTMGASGELRSIKDRQENELTFTHDGIVSNTGRVLAFQRDALNRITKVTSPPLDAGNGTIVHQYEYDAAGNLSKVDFPDNTNAQYTYGADRLLLTAKDNNGNLARTSTYDAAGRLLADKDALGNVTSYAYDLTAHKTTTTNPDLGTVEQMFDDRGLLLEEVDPLGRKTEHTYDENKNELTRKNALGEVTTFTYDAQGNRTSSTNARGETRRVAYNEFSRPVTDKDAAGHTIRTEYSDLPGVPKRISDEIGTITTIASSEHGLPISKTDAVGNATFFAYDPYGSVAERLDRLGRRTSYGYDGAGRRTTSTPPRGGATVMYYSARGAVTFVDTPTGIFAQSGFGFQYDGNLNRVVADSHLGRRSNRNFDALNHLTSIDRDDFTTVRYTRDFRGNPLTFKDESGRTTTYEYDKVGQLKKTTFPDGTFITKDYDALGRLVTETDERGSATAYEYQAGCDCDKRPTKVTDPLGRATTTAYDAVGRRTSVTDPAGHTTSYEYDVRGNLTRTTYADGTFELDTWDVLDRRTSHKDQMGSVTQFGHDAEGQLTSVTDALSSVTRYAYDVNGNLTSTTDANNHTTSYGYDLRNQKTMRTLPLGMSETFTYDLFGEVISHVDFGGKTTTMTYDRRGRLLTKVPDPTLAEPTVTFTYNPTGTRATMIDASGSTSYTYDVRDRLLTKAAPAGTLTYGYDAAANVATVRSSNSNGTSVDYAWDAANQLVSVKDNRAGGTTTSAYTGSGRPAALIEPNGVGASYSYDARDRVTTLAWQRSTEDSAFGSWSYTYNGRGQRKSVTDGTTRSVAYGYDASARLESETITNDPQGAAGNGELSYSLDAFANRVSRSSTLAALSSQTLTYDANDQIVGDGFDSNGNTTTSGGHTYAYDFENRLVSKDGGVVTVVYDGDGNRVAKTVGGVTTKYLVDDRNPTGYLQVLEETVGGSVQVAYTYGTMPVSQRRAAAGGAVSYYGYDAHHNVAFVTDVAGVVTDTYDYDAWGNLVASTGTTPNSRRFGGEELDADLGLINLRARQYKPSTGRFLTIDPESGDLKNPFSLNRYLYANADPTNARDPSGRTALLEMEAVDKWAQKFAALAVALYFYEKSEHLSELGPEYEWERDCLRAATVAGAVAEFLHDSGAWVALGVDTGCDLGVVAFGMGW